jgi:3-oxoadipate enol-lactonase
VAPALIIHGTADPDPIEGAKAWATALPHASLVTMHGVGHFPHVERPAEFSREVDRFLGGA